MSAEIDPELDQEPVVRRRMSAALRAEQLLDVAERLFAERGYADTSIEDIARAAGVTRPIVYQRLGNKEAAYLAVVERVRVHLEEAFTAAALDSTDPRDQLAAGIGAFFDYLEQEPRRWKILYGSSTPMVGELGEQLGAARFRTVELIASLLRFHVDGSEDDVQTMAHLVSGGLEQLGRWWIRNPDVDHADLVARATDVLWAGLAPHVAQP